MPWMFLYWPVIVHVNPLSNFTGVPFRLGSYGLPFCSGILEMVWEVESWVGNAQ